MFRVQNKDYYYDYYYKKRTGYVKKYLEISYVVDLFDTH